MKVEEFNYKFDKRLIAQKPKNPKDRSRLLVFDRQKNKTHHTKFYKISKFLNKGDVIVLNNSKVFPARLIGHKETGGKVEILLLNPINMKKNIPWEKQWNVISHPGIKEGQIITFGDLEAEVIDSNTIEFNEEGDTLKKQIFKFGKTPTPPYIKSKIKEKSLQNKYQTVYAENFGSAAAPTAGFHFTNRLIKKLKKKGIIFKYITLHVGLGTFEPIKTDDVESHKMSSEWAEIDKKTANFLNEAKANGQKIITVGTTSTRTLEGFYDREIKHGEKYLDIFMYPGYEFKFIDSMITNFHLPKSTPLLLISALIGKDKLFKIYKVAQKRKYRFYSFGDAMLII